MKKLKPYEMIGTPEANSGSEILSPQKLARMIADNPKIQDAIDLVNRVEGVPRMYQRIIHEVAKKTAHIVSINKFQIDAQMRKIATAGGSKC